MWNPLVRVFVLTDAVPLAESVCVVPIWVRAIEECDRPGGRNAPAIPAMW